MRFTLLASVAETVLPLTLCDAETASPCTLLAGDLETASPCSSLRAALALLRCFRIHFWCFSACARSRQPQNNANRFYTTSSILTVGPGIHGTTDLFDTSLCPITPTARKLFRREASNKSLHGGCSCPSLGSTQLQVVRLGISTQLKVVRLGLRCRRHCRTLDTAATILGADCLQRCHPFRK